MKKIVVFLILISNFAFAIEFSIGKEFSTGVKLKIDDVLSTEIDMKDNVGVYAEVSQGEIDLGGVPATAGVGIKLNSFFNGDTQVIANGTLYAVVRFEADFSSFKPYAQLKFGYPKVAEGDYIKAYTIAGNPITDVVGTYYFGAGVGATVYFVDLSVNYDYNTYKLKTISEEVNGSNGNVSFNVGVKF